MNNYFIGFILLLTFFIGCAHSPKCGNPDGAKIIYEGQRTCTVRIRQVLIGNELKIPESLKNPELASLELTWADPIMKEGQIISGHFILLPRLKSEAISPVNPPTTKVNP